MLKKRSRSTNWDEEEKQLLRHVLKDYTDIIENKSLHTNTNKKKSVAWEEIHKKFNELNNRFRDLTQIKIQWKGMKVNARKIYSMFKTERDKTGGGPQQELPCETVIEITNLLNPAELLRDSNIYSDNTDTDNTDNIDSDGNIPSSSNCKDSLITTSEPCVIAMQDSTQAITVISSIDQEIEKNSICIKDIDAHEITPSMNLQGNTNATTPEHNNLGTARKVFKRKNLQNYNPQRGPGFGKVHDEYIKNMISHSKMLKNEEHTRRMQMAEEEHSIQMAIHREELKCAVLEREILEFKKACNENLDINIGHNL